MTDEASAAPTPDRTSNFLKRILLALAMPRFGLLGWDFLMKLRQPRARDGRVSFMDRVELAVETSGR